MLKFDLAKQARMNRFTSELSKNGAMIPLKVNPEPSKDYIKIAADPKGKKELVERLNSTIAAENKAAKEFLEQLKTTNAEQNANNLNVIDYVV